jgi:hypothetical protein
MNTENRNFETDQDMRRDRSREAVLVEESMRSATTPSGAAVSGLASPSIDKVPLFWQVFGGTIVSVVALMVITAFNQLNSYATDLRRDVNQLQVEQVRKDELNVRLNTLWKSVKDLQTTTASRASVEESTGVLHHDLETRIKANDDQLKDVQRQMEQLGHRVQALAERLAAVESASRLTNTTGVTSK